MKLSRQIVPTLALLLIFSSCSPRRSEIALRPSEVPPSTLVRLVDAADAKLVSMTGSGTITFESPENAGSASFDISLRKPDSLLVAFEGPFGIDVGTLFLSRQLFVMYNSMENRVISGVPTARAIRSVVPFDMTYDQILNAFTGAFPIAEGGIMPLSYTVNDEQFRLVFACGSDSCCYWVDPADLLVRRYERHDSTGQVVMEATSSGTIEDGSVRMPRRITVSFPEERRRVTIHFSRAQLNPPSVSFAFFIPPNARTSVR
jgi:outer membrane lipoprotein-sorting protein